MRVQLNYQDVAKIVEEAVSRRFGGTWAATNAYCLPAEISLEPIETAFDDAPVEQLITFSTEKVAA